MVLERGEVRRKMEGSSSSGISLVEKGLNTGSMGVIMVTEFLSLSLSV